MKELQKFLDGALKTTNKSPVVPPTGWIKAKKPLGICDACNCHSACHCICGNCPR